MFSKMKFLALAIATAMLMSTSTTAHAVASFDVTIDFGGLSGANGTVLTSYSEDGFTLTPTAGDWREAQLWGNPVPSIFTVGTTTHTVSLSLDTGGVFVFDAADFGCGIAASSSCLATVIGYRNGTQVFSLFRPLTVQGVFTTVGTPVAAPQVDTLLVSLDQNDSNLDNIRLTVIPEPGTLALFGLGLLILGFARYRRARAA